MSAFSPARRHAVAARADHRCEYCQLPNRGQVATFPIDHVIPKSAGGSNEPDNLALTCPHCNSHKWTATHGDDPAAVGPARLFHPRQDDWAEHFEWSADDASELVGRTPTGRATIHALRINADDMLELRRLLARVGLLR